MAALDLQSPNQQPLHRISCRCHQVTGTRWRVSGYHAAEFLQRALFQTVPGAAVERNVAPAHPHVREPEPTPSKTTRSFRKRSFSSAVKEAQTQVTLSDAENAEFSSMQSRVVDFAQIVRPNDPELFIHIITSEEEQCLTERMKALPCTLDDLGIDASTGPVVDFRLKAYLRRDPEPGTVPLIYPVRWQKPFCRLAGGRRQKA